MPASDYNDETKAAIEASLADHDAHPFDSVDEMFDALEGADEKKDIHMKTADETCEEIRRENLAASDDITKRRQYAERRCAEFLAEDDEYLASPELRDDVAAHIAAAVDHKATDSTERFHTYSGSRLPVIYAMSVLEHGRDDVRTPMHQAEFHKDADTSHDSSTYVTERCDDVPTPCNLDVPCGRMERVDELVTSCTKPYGWHTWRELVDFPYIEEPCMDAGVEMLHDAYVHFIEADRKNRSLRGFSRMRARHATIKAFEDELALYGLSRMNVDTIQHLLNRPDDPFWLYSATRSRIASQPNYDTLRHDAETFDAIWAMSGKVWHYYLAPEPTTDTKEN